MSSRNVTHYLEKREIPQLFECLMTGLMFHKPENHIEFLLNCLREIRDGGVNAARWNLFIDQTKVKSTDSEADVILPEPKSSPRLDSPSKENSFPLKFSPLPPISSSSNDEISDDNLKVAEGNTSSIDKQEITRDVKSPRNREIICVMGGPNSGFEHHCEVLQTSSDKFGSILFVDEKEQHIKNLTQAIEESKADIIIIQGTLDNVDQISMIEKVREISKAYLLDCSESFMISRQPSGDGLIQSEIQKWKEKSFPILRHFDSVGKLTVIDGEMEFCKVQTELQNSIHEDFFEDDEISMEEKASKKVRSLVDPGRNSLLHNVPLVILLGGPGSYRPNVINVLSAKYKQLHIISVGNLFREKMSVDKLNAKWSIILSLIEKGEMIPTLETTELVIENFKKHAKSAKVVLLEGYPRSMEQLETLYEQVGGVMEVILLDTSEKTMFDRLEKMETEGLPNYRKDINEKKMNLWKTESLTVLRHFDNNGKLKIINGDASVDDVIKETVDALKSWIGDDVQTQGITCAATIQEEEPIIEETFHPEQAFATLPTGNPYIRKDMLQDAKVIFVIGGPGSGKGTQCEKIVKEFGFTHLSTGDLLREEVKSESEMAKKLNIIMEKGELVSLDIILELLRGVMEKSIASSNGFLIDGFPREVEQALKFEREVTSCRCALFFEVSDETMTSRLLNRAKSSGRVDDNEETIKKRLSTFHDCTAKVLEYLRENETLCTISAERSAEDIFADVRTILADI